MTEDFITDLKVKIQVRTGPSHWQPFLQATDPPEHPHCLSQAPAAPPSSHSSARPDFTFQKASPNSFACLSLIVLSEQSLNYTFKAEKTQQKRGESTGGCRPPSPPMSPWCRKRPVVSALQDVPDPAVPASTWTAKSRPHRAGNELN